MRVLFVDDEADILELIEIAIIFEEDIESQFLGSGVEAIELIGREPFDIIVLDVMMPPPDGLEILRAARENSDINNTLIVMCTAKTSVEAERQFFELGADHVLHKPFKPLQLADYLRKIRNQ